MRLLSFIEPDVREVWVDEASVAYATVAVDGHLEHHAISDVPFTRWIRNTFYRRHETSVKKGELENALETLEAKAHAHGRTYPTFLRVAHHEGAVYVDLCNAAWEAVRIDERGYSVESNPPVRFRRAPGMNPLPYPKEGAGKDDFDVLRRVLNLPDDGDKTFSLILGFIIGAFNPAGTYPLLVVYGGQGSGKSTLSSMLHRLIDPSVRSRESLPRSERDLFIRANNGFLLSYDNVSVLRRWLSDALCLLATGGSFGQRKLYSDSEEVMMSFARPVLVNGITEFVVRDDLVDRSLTVVLPDIPATERKGFEAVKGDFDAAYPNLLGAVYSAVSMALRRREHVHLDELPRMADLAVWVEAAGPALPVSEGTFLLALEASREAAAVK